LKKIIIISGLLAAISSPVKAWDILPAPMPSNLGLFDSAPNSDLFTDSVGTWSLMNAFVSPANTSVPGYTLAPLNNGHRYMATEGAVFINLAHPATSISFEWGSIDRWNTISFDADGGTVITGQMVSDYLSDHGVNITFGSSSEYVTIDHLFPFTNVVFQTSAPAFEFQFASADAIGSVPEASTWIMLMTGFASLFYAGRRKVKRAHSHA